MYWGEKNYKDKIYLNLGIQNVDIQTIPIKWKMTLKKKLHL